MPSKDFLRLMKFMYDKKFRVIGTTVSFNRKDGMGAEIELEKNSEKIKIKSWEPDFMMYVGSIKNIIDEEGNFKLVKIKNTNKYYDDIDFLLDEDKKKTHEAVKRISANKFDFEGLNIEKTLDRFLLRKRIPKDKEILKLKEWYYEIFAYYLLFSNQVNKFKELAIDKSETRESYFKLSDSLLLKGFLKIGNPIKDYLFYREYCDLDIFKLFEKTKEQSDYIKLIVERMSIKPVKSEQGIQVILDFYRRISELLKPLINLLRVCVEIKDGNEKPRKFLSYIQNVNIIRADKDFGKLAEFIDPYIRNNESHLETFVDNKNMKVLLRNPKGIIVKEYSFDEVIEMTHTLERMILSSLLFSFLIFNCAVRLLVFQDGRYKMTLLGLGNT